MPLPFCASMACVMTSSPTRLMSWSTFSTLTRSVLDSGDAAALDSAFGAAGLGAAAGAAASAAGVAAAAAPTAWFGAPGASSKKP